MSSEKQPHKLVEPHPLDEHDDVYPALAAREGPWFMQGEDGELIPISREQVAQALAWRRRPSR